jgi:hypothetical protein
VIHLLKAEYESNIDDLRLLLAKVHNAEVDRMMRKFGPLELISAYDSIFNLLQRIY